MTNDPWLEASATYAGERCRVWIDLRRIVGVVLREKSLYLEGDSCSYDVDLPNGSHYAQGRIENCEYADNIIARIRSLTQGLMNATGADVASDEAQEQSAEGGD